MILALASGILQVLCFSLPSRVVCYRSDRAPRIELFSGACSCSQERSQSCRDHEQHTAPHLEQGCTDIPLRADALLASTARRQRISAGSPRRLPVPERAAALPDHLPFPPASTRGGLPSSAAPPPPGALAAVSPLRC